MTPEHKTREPHGRPVPDSTPRSRPRADTATPRRVLTASTIVAQSLVPPHDYEMILESFHQFQSLLLICNRSTRTVGASFRETVLLIQALSLVPSSLPTTLRLKMVSNILKEGLGLAYTPDNIKMLAHSLQQEHGDSLRDLGIPHLDLLWAATFTTHVHIPHTEFLGPPVEKCIECDDALYSHNASTSCVCYTFSGPVMALKTTLRCRCCGTNYR